VSNKNEIDMTTSKYIYKGITDSVTDCDCCGKSDLKRTVVLLDTELNDFKYFGTTCARNAANWTVEQFKKEKENYKKIKTVADFDIAISNQKSGYSKARMCSKALKKGYDRDELFKKHGEVLEITPWEIVYNIEHLVHRVAKN